MSIAAAGDTLVCAGSTDQKLLNSVGEGLASAADADLLRSLLERSGLCLATLDLTLHVVEANGDFAERFGHSLESVRGRNLFELMHPGVHASMREQFDRLLERRRLQFVEQVAGIGPMEVVFTGDLTAVSVYNDAGELTMIAVVVNAERSDTVPGHVDRRRILNELDARILEGIAVGESTMRLACRLFLSRQGVEYHVGLMLRRFRAPNRAALVSRAYSIGVLSMATWPPKVTPDFVK